MLFIFSELIQEYEKNCLEKKEKDKLLESLISSIDTDEHNDVEIIFEDGVIEASKLILSTTRSADFQKVFNKNIQFQEQKKISVQFPCKELTIKMKIL